MAAATEVLKMLAGVQARENEFGAGSLTRFVGARSITEPMTSSNAQCGCSH